MCMYSHNDKLIFYLVYYIWCNIQHCYMYVAEVAVVTLRVGLVLLIIFIAVICFLVTKQINNWHHIALYITCSCIYTVA